MRAADVLVSAGRPISFHSGLARGLRSITAALMLGQLLYWTDKSGDGWVWKLESDWDAELALTPEAMKGARSILVGLGIVEHVRRGSPGRPHYRVDFDALEEWWQGAMPTVLMAGNAPSRQREMPGLDGGSHAIIPLQSIDDGIDDSRSSPRPRGAASRETKPKFSEDATRLARSEWNRRSEKPICGFVALRLRIQEAIDAGYSPDAISTALPSMPVFSRNAFDLALSRVQKPNKSQGDRSADIVTGWVNGN